MGRHSSEQTEAGSLLQEAAQLRLGRPWNLLVWNDPVNLMSYVEWIFRSYFGYPQSVATELMLTVHNEGRAVVATGTREEVERHAIAMHGFGLSATLQQQP